jgi:hypothetical protein
MKNSSASNFKNSNPTTRKSNILPLTKNHKNYDDVPDGLKWAIPIHECLESPEVKQRSKRLEDDAKIKVEKEFREMKIKVLE